MMMSTLPCSRDDVCGLMQVQLATKSLHELVRPMWTEWEMNIENLNNNDWREKVV